MIAALRLMSNRGRLKIDGEAAIAIGPAAFPFTEFFGQWSPATSPGFQIGKKEDADTAEF